jgi:hypothetical protein
MEQNAQLLIRFCSVETLAALKLIAKFIPVPCALCCYFAAMEFIAVHLDNVGILAWGPVHRLRLRPAPDAG